MNIIKQDPINSGQGRTSNNVFRRPPLPELSWLSITQSLAVDSANQKYVTSGFIRSLTQNRANLTIMLINVQIEKYYKNKIRINNSK